MNTIVVLLAAALLSAIAVIIILLGKNSILGAKNKLYQGFFKRTPVKKFLSVLNGINSKAMDSEITLMLEKYFELVLRNLHYSNVPNLLRDLDESKHSVILRKCLIHAALTNNDAFGFALATNIENPKNKLAIELFLSNLPEEQKKKQYQIALRFMEKEYHSRVIDLPSEYRKPWEEAMEEYIDKI